jgi:hypothetical protein
VVAQIAKTASGETRRLEGAVPDWPGPRSTGLDGIR